MRGLGWCWGRLIDISWLCSAPAEVFDISFNELEELPDMIKELKSVKDAVMNNNLLSTITRNIGSLKTLVKLNLAFNKLTKLPDELTQLANLQVGQQW